MITLYEVPLLHYQMAKNSAVNRNLAYVINTGIPLKNDSFYYDFMLFFLQILCFFMPKAL